jgi:phospholipid/cholesterol/gamma-HCH transport system substrate-binding protein
VKFSKEIKVALLGIAAILALYFGFMVLKGSDLFSRTRTFYAIYDNVDGLNISNPVLLSGITVGHVQDMQILQNRNNRVLVTLDINKDVVIGDSTVGSLSSSDLLGSKAIVLFAGRHQTLYTGGDTIISHVEQSFTEMLSQKSMPLLGTIDTTLQKVNSFFEEDGKRSLRATMLHTEATIEALKNMLVANQQNVNQITSNMAALTSSLRQSEQKFSQIASNLVAITDTLREADFNEVVRNLNATVSEAQSLVQKMNSDTGSLGKLVNNDSLYQNLNHFSENLDRLMVDIRERPNRYVHFSVFGRRGKGEAVTADTLQQARNGRSAEKAGEVKR